MSKLAMLGGVPAVSTTDLGMFKWPIVTPEMESAVLKVLHDGSMSGIGITENFEAGYAAWHQCRYALAHSSGTAALHAAMYGVGLGPGDELICPSVTYWASCTQALSLGARVVFADIEADSLCLDPASFEAHITPRTKAVVIVHYLSHPADMDALMKVARKHGLKVIEDVSHAQGGLYKGRLLGTFGDVGACSLMSGKSFAIGEGGMLYTNNQEIYEKAILFGHYERIGKLEVLKLPEGVGMLPWGGYKYRLNQMASAIGLIQLQKYASESAEIDKAMCYFSKGIEGVPGCRKHYPVWPDSNKAGWYASCMHYRSEELDGLSPKLFCEALKAEGCEGFRPGCNFPLHQARLFYDVDIYGHGKPSADAHFKDGSLARDCTGELPVASSINQRVVSIPWFKHCRTEVIDQYINAIHKVIENHKELLELQGQDAKEVQKGRWSFTH